jgi:acyl-CoA-dependent ceramide synthase
MALLRDGARLFLFEPFARWKLTENLKAARQKQLLVKQNGHASNGSTNGYTNGYANGLANGHTSSMSKNDIRLTPADIRKMNRNVMRFAEQGWALIYYAIQFCVGVVSFDCYFLSFHFD